MWQLRKILELSRKIILRQMLASKNMNMKAEDATWHGKLLPGNWRRYSRLCALANCSVCAKAKAV
jgi:hypothetical protein